MANHASAEKRIRSNERKRVRNRVRKTVLKSAVKKFRETKEKKSASEQLPAIVSLLDKMAGKNIIHKSRAANLKSKLTKQVNALQ